MNLNEAQLTIFNYNNLMELNESILNSETINEYKLVNIFSKNISKFNEFAKTYKSVINKMETDLNDTGVNIDLYNKKVDNIFEKIESKLTIAIKSKDNNKVKDIFEASAKEIVNIEKEIANPKLIISVPFIGVKLALKIIGLFKFFIKFIIKIMFILIKPFEKFKKIIIPMAIGAAALFLYPALVHLKEIFYSETPKWDTFKTLVTFDISDYLKEVHETGVYIFLKDIIMTIFNFLDSTFGDIIHSLLELIVNLF